MVTVSVAGGPASTKTTLEVPHSCSVRFLKRAIERASGVSLACMHMKLAGTHMYVAGSSHKRHLGTTGFLRDQHKLKFVQKGCTLSSLKLQLPLKSSMHEHLLPTQTQALPGACLHWAGASAPTFQCSAATALCLKTARRRLKPEMCRTHSHHPCVIKSNLL